MRYKVGAEQLQQVPRTRCSEWPGPLRLAQPTPSAPLGAAACGIKADQLQVLDQDWEAACFIEKCPGCFAVAITHCEAEADKR